MEEIGKQTVVRNNQQSRKSNSLLTITILNVNGLNFIIKGTDWLNWKKKKTNSKPTAFNKLTLTLQVGWKQICHTTVTKIE